MRPQRLPLTIAAIAVVSALCGDAALAVDVCTQLEADLVNADRGGGSASAENFAKYDDAVNRQRDELSRATAEARRAGCMGGFLFFRSRPEPKCGALMAMLDRMQSNLARLQSRRGQFAYDPGDAARNKSRILQALAANNCGPQYAQRETFMSSIFGPRGSGYGGRSSGFWWNDQSDDYYPSDGFDSGTFRTLCVRTCDGYYFPISFSTVRAQFANDEQVCQSMCPGEEVKLFIHHNPGEDSDAMVSTTGEPYSSEPYAFAYRNAYNPSCTCKPAIQATMFGADGVALPGAVAVPVPIRRPDPGLDPETAANEAGGFTPVPVAPAANPAVAGLRPQAETKVRVVGPSYYYAQ